MVWQKLIEEALEARKAAYAPYSEFAVGAALLTRAGRIFRGCNIENAAYSPTNCAERTAIFKAVSEGERDFIAIAVCGGHEGEESSYCFPCGVCRQVMMEFTDPKKFMVVVAKTMEEYKVFCLDELLPHGFGPKNL
jgi:cytidine deaminase